MKGVAESGVVPGVEAGGSEICESGEDGWVEELRDGGRRGEPDAGDEEVAKTREKEGDVVQLKKVGG